MAIWGLLCLHTNFKIFHSSSVKNAIDNLIGIALNLLIALGGIVILMILILPIQEHGIAFHLLVSSFISLINVLYIFLKYSSWLMFKVIVG